MSFPVRQIKKDEWGVVKALFAGHSIERISAAYGHRPTPEKVLFRVSQLKDENDLDSVAKLYSQEFDSLDKAVEFIDGAIAISLLAAVLKIEAEENKAR